MNAKKVLGIRTKKSVKGDLIKVVYTLCEQHVFEEQETREAMSCFPDPPWDYLQLLSSKGLWLDERTQREI